MLRNAGRERLAYAYHSLVPPHLLLDHVDEVIDDGPLWPRNASPQQETVKSQVVEPLDFSVDVPHDSRLGAPSVVLPDGPDT